MFVPVEKTHIGSYMSARVLLNLSNELAKVDKMRGLSIILSLFPNEFHKFNNSGAQMLDFIYSIALNCLYIVFWRENVKILPLFTQR